LRGRFEAGEIKKGRQGCGKERKEIENGRNGLEKTPPISYELTAFTVLSFVAAVTPKLLYFLHRRNNRRDRGDWFPNFYVGGPTMYWSPNFLAVVFKKQEIS